VIIATPLSLLVQVPPVDGDTKVLLPAHITLLPETTAVGLLLTMMSFVGFEAQPTLLVKVKFTLPALRADTIPLLVTVATLGLLLVHVPPIVGVREVVLCAHTIVFPIMFATGLSFIVTMPEGLEVHPVLAFVYVNETGPALMPVTIPLEFTVAMALLLLAQVPPEEGDNVVVAPMHILLLPAILAVGLLLTVTSGLLLDTQPVALFVYVNCTAPDEIP
jgi:hypothetical protein